MSACVDAFDVLLEREVCVEKYAEKLDLCLSLDVFVLYVDWCTISQCLCLGVYPVVDTSKKVAFFSYVQLYTVEYRS